MLAVRTLKPKEKLTSFSLLPYFQMTYSWLSRILAKYNIKCVSLQPRKNSSLFHLVKDDLGVRTPGVLQHTLWVWSVAHPTDW
jgi:hypothetical protein